MTVRRFGPGPNNGRRGAPSPSTADREGATHSPAPHSEQVLRGESDPIASAATFVLTVSLLALFVRQVLASAEILFPINYNNNIVILIFTLTILNIIQLKVSTRLF